MTNSFRINNWDLAERVGELSEKVKTTSASLAEIVIKNNKPTRHNTEREAMISFVDDDLRKQVMTKLKPIFVEKKVPCGVAVITSKLKSLNGDESYCGLNELNELYDTGYFEVMAHTENHVALNTLTREEQEKEIKNSYETLNKLGFETETMVYPYGGNDKITRAITNRYFKNALGTNNDINKLPFVTYNMYRVPFGSFTLTGQDTFEFYKSKVDLAIASGYWLIFMLHCAEGSHNDTQTQILGQLIDYIKQTNTKIVRVSEGFNNAGNRVEIGDYEDKNYRVLASDGRGSFGDTIHKPLDYIESSDLPSSTKFNKGRTYICPIYHKRVGYPSDLSGTVQLTIPDDDYSFSYETYTPRGANPKIMTRTMNGEVWGEWKDITSSTASSYNHLGLDSILATDLVSDSKFKIGNTYVCPIYHKSADYPTGKSGVVELVIPNNDDRSYSYQYYHTRDNGVSRLFKRSVKSDGTWGSFFEIKKVKEYTSVGNQTNTFTINANSFKEVLFTVENININSKFTVQPLFNIPNGCIWSYSYSADWQVRVTMYNSTSSNITLTGVNFNIQVE